MSTSNLRARAFDTIVLGGFTAGVLDIADAFIVTTINGGTPTRVLQAIASGMLGREAYQGGAPVAALGLALHFLIACSAAAVSTSAGIGVSLSSPPTLQAARERLSSAPGDSAPAHALRFCAVAAFSTIASTRARISSIFSKS